MRAGNSHTHIALFFILIGASVFSLLYVNPVWCADLNEKPGLEALCFHKNRTLTPEDFGAKGDGISDDTTPFLSALRSGYPIMCNGYYRLNKKSLPIDDKGNPIFPTIKNRIVVSGSGTVQFDFHINVSGIIEVRDVRLCSAGHEPNGLFTVSKKGRASFRNVTFDGTNGSYVSGGVASRGELSVEHCFFLQSDVNIIAPQGSFYIKNSVFDGFNANSSSFLSNELIHIQSCKSGVIDSCTFRNSLQDVVDFYYGAKNVIFENNEVYDNSSTLFEIKAEYRNSDNPQGGNQVYRDHTENIVIRKNSFHVTNGIAWVGTRSDNRTNRSYEDGFYVRDVVFDSNKIVVSGGNKVDLWFARNIKGLSIINNEIESVSTPVFVLRVMEGELYETCENVCIENNNFKCPSISLLYISGNISDIQLRNNYIVHNNSESYLVLTTKNKKHIGKVNIEKNNVEGGVPIRFCTASIPLTCDLLRICDQKVKAFYLDTINQITFTSCISPIVYQSGDVNDYFIHSCVEPLIISEGYLIRNLHIEDTEIKKTPTFIANREGLIENARYNNLNKSVLYSKGIRIIKTNDK